jgi:hypothetical protein
MKRAEEYRKRAEEAEARAENTRDAVRSRLILRSPSSGDNWPNMQSTWNAKAASVGNSSLAEAFLAPCRINPDAGAARLIHYCEAGAVAFRAALTTKAAKTLDQKLILF